MGLSGLSLRVLRGEVVGVQVGRGGPQPPLSCVLVPQRLKVLLGFATSLCDRSCESFITENDFFTQDAVAVKPLIMKMPLLYGH